MSSNIPFTPKLKHIEKLFIKTLFKINSLQSEITAIKFAKFKFSTVKAHVRTQLNPMKN